jgi:hypothetical protein
VKYGGIPGRFLADWCSYSPTFKLNPGLPMYPGDLSWRGSLKKRCPCTSARYVTGRGGFIHPKSSGPNSLEKRDRLLDKWHLKWVDAIDPSRAPGSIGVRHCLRLGLIPGEIFGVHGFPVYIHPDHETRVTTRTVLNHGPGVSIDATSNRRISGTHQPDEVSISRTMGYVLHQHHPAVPMNHPAVPMNHPAVPMNHPAVPMNHPAVPMNHAAARLSNNQAARLMNIPPRTTRNEGMAKEYAQKRPKPAN